MAATVLVTDVDVQGNQQVKTVKVTADTSYPTGGYSITPASLGLAAFTFVNVACPTTTGYIPVFNVSTNKLMLFWGANGAVSTEITAATNVATSIAYLQFQGN